MVTDYAELYQEWRPYAQMMIHNAGFYDADLAEDLLQDIFEKAQRDDWLSNFDESRASFDTFIVNHIRYAIRTRRRRIAHRAQYEYVADLTDPATTEKCVTSGDLTEVEFEMAVRAVEQDLRELPVTSSKNLAQLFEVIVRHMAEGKLKTDGSLDLALVAQDLGIKRQSVSNWLDSLRVSDPMKLWYRSLRD